MDAIKAIKSRTSIRKYKPAAIAKEILEDIVDCGRLAPSGYNDQPWTFVVVTDAEIKAKIAEKTTYGKFIPEAGACIAVFCHKSGRTLIEDACAATENIIIAAQAYDLGSCWVNSHKKEHSQYIEELLKCPPDCELMTLIAIGVPYEKTAAAHKKKLQEVLRWNTF